MPNVGFGDLMKDTINVGEQGEKFNDPMLRGSNNVFKKKGVTAF